MVGRSRTRTKADEARMMAIEEIGCIACAIDGNGGVPCDIDHLLSGSVRFEDEHQHTIGLDPWHHRGVVPECCRGSVDKATMKHGPSREHNSKDFAARYGNDDQLFVIQNALLREHQRSNRRGEYLSKREIAKLARVLHAEIVLGRSPTIKEAGKLERVSV